MKNEQIIKAFLNNQYAQNKNLRTDGQSLYSYNLLIGKTTQSGLKQIFNYTAPHAFISHTTSKHIGMARRHNTQIIPPPHPLQTSDTSHNTPTPSDS